MGKSTVALAQCKAMEPKKTITFPDHLTLKLKTARILSFDDGEAYNSVGVFQGMVYHGVRGAKSLHMLCLDSFDLDYDGVLDLEEAHLWKWHMTKTFKPTLLVPVDKRVVPPAYELKDDPVMCGVTYLKKVRDVRPLVNKSNPGRDVPRSLFLTPIPRGQLAFDPMSGKVRPEQVMFRPVPLGVHSISKIVPQWMDRLGLNPLNTDGEPCISGTRITIMQ